jgi:hypothetical protein
LPAKLKKRLSAGVVSLSVGLGSILGSWLSVPRYDGVPEISQVINGMFVGIVLVGIPALIGASVFFVRGWSLGFTFYVIISFLISFRTVSFLLRM